MSGWIIVVAAVVCLHGRSVEPVFAVAGGAVQIAGLVLLFRTHAIAPGERQ
jgi:hypothetical protein